MRTPDHLPRCSKKTAGKVQAGSSEPGRRPPRTVNDVTTEHTSETDMTHSAHRAARSRSPAADVIRLPHRTVARPAGPAIEPPGLPAYVPDVLRRAAEDLAFAEAVLQPGPKVPDRRGAGTGRSGPAAPEDPAVPGAAPDGTRVEVRMLDAETFAREVERGRMSVATGSATTAARAYRSALALWTGDPLMENMYAEWAQRFRRRFSLLYEEALDGLAKASLELGQATTAQDAARQLTQRAPLGEEGHLLLMKALAAAGDPAGAIRAFHEWRGRLAAELGVDPSPEAQGVFQHILRNELPERVRRVPPDTPPPGSQCTALPGLPGDVLGWIPDAVYVLGHDERLVYANQPAADLSGLPVGCLAGMTARAVFPGDWLEAYRSCAGTALAARGPGCFRAFCAPLDCWLEWTVYPGEQGFLILSRDVTRMVKTEQRVRRALAAVQASRSDLLTRPSGDEGEPRASGRSFP